MESRQLVFGYILEHFMMTAGEQAQARQNLVDYATANNFDLTATYMEKVETVPAKFRELLAEADARQVQHLVIPGLLHLAALGSPVGVRDHLIELGIEVHVARHAD
jgi:hypothetical protein